MKNTIAAKLPRFLPVLVAFASLPLKVDAAGFVIVEDNFDRTGTLVGSNADTGQTWSGSGPFVTTGTVYQVDGSTTSFASIDGLSFLPSSTYCLSVDMTVFLPISDGWLGLGFSSPTSTDIATATVGAFQLTQNPDVVSHPSDLTLPQIDSVSGTTFFTNHVLTITLDTGASLVNSTLSWQVDSAPPVRSGVAVDASAIDGIFLAHASTEGLFRGQFDRLLLLGPIPEPSAVSLLALGGLTALARRRRPAKFQEPKES